MSAADHNPPDQKPPHRFACGCLIESTPLPGGGFAAVLTACPLGEACQVVRMAAEVSAEQNKPYVVVDAS